MIRTALDSQIEARVESFALELADLVKRSALAAVQEALGATARTRTSDVLAPRRGPRPRVVELAPAAPRPQQKKVIATGAPADASLDLLHYERMAYQRAIAENGGDLLAAAKALGVGKSTIYRRMRMLGIPLEGVPESGSFLVTDQPVTLAGYERLAVERALSETGGDRLAAAKLLQVGKSTLYRMVSKHGLG